MPERPGREIERLAQIPRLAAGARMPSARARNAVDHVYAKGLVEEAGSSGGYTLYRLAAEGRADIQRHASARRADVRDKEGKPLAGRRKAPTEAGASHEAIIGRKPMNK